MTLVKVEGLLIEGGKLKQKSKLVKDTNGDCSSVKLPRLICSGLEVRIGSTET